MGTARTKWILELDDRVTGSVKQVTASIRSARDETEQANSTFKKLRNAMAGMVSAYAVIRGAKAILNLGMQAETAETKFEVLTGSMGAAKKMLDDINQFANLTPFDNAELRQNAELLLNFGIAQEKVLPTLKMLGDVSGGNREKLRSLALAYAQVQSTGKLMGQDLLQMINAGFNPLQVISEKTGKSMAQLKEEMSKGKISAQMVEEAFRAATSEGGRFHGMMEKVSQTASGKLSTLLGVARSKIAAFSKNNLIPWLNKAIDAGIRFVNNFGKVWDAFMRLVSPIGEVIKSVWELVAVFFGFNDKAGESASVTDKLASAFNFLSVPVKIVGSGLAQLLRWMKPFVPVIKVGAIVVGGLSAAFWILNAAMTANPVGLVIVGVSTLIGLLKLAYEKVDWFRGAVDAAKTGLLGFGKMIKDYIVNRLKELLSGITGIGKSLYYFFTGEWKKAWEAGAEGVKNLMGVNSARKAVQDAKKLGEDMAVAYDRGVAKGKYKDYDPSKALAGIASYQVTPSETGPVAAATASPTGYNFDIPTVTESGQRTGKTTTGGIKAGTSSGGGSGRRLVMNLDITNVFNMAKGTKVEIEQFSEQIVRRIVDKLRDAEIGMA